MSELLVIGSLNSDLVVTVRRAPEAGETVIGEAYSSFRGGKGANQAIAAVRLGGEVAMLGRVGEDANGADLLEGLQEESVAVGGTRRLSGVATGVAMITVDAGGENRIVVVPGANDRFTMKELRREEAAFKAANYVLLQLEIPFETVVEALRLAKRNGCITILDPAPARELPDAVLGLVDYLTPNESELVAVSRISGEAPLDEVEVVEGARRMLRRGVSKVVAKRGARGAMLVGEDGELEVPAPRVDVVDTTAAGDCFNAAFAVALSRGEGEERAIAYACAAASVSVTRRGAQASMPRASEVSE